METVPTMEHRTKDGEFVADAEEIFEAKNVSFSYNDETEI